MREYIYIPLGGNRRGHLSINILVTFAIAAMWHGWKYNILLWGAVNAVIVVIEKKWAKKEAHIRMPAAVRIAVTAFIIMMGWVLFSSADMEAACESFKALFVSSYFGAIPNFSWRFFLTRRIIVFLVIAAVGAFGGFRKLGTLMKNKMSEVAFDITIKLLLIVLLAVDIMFAIGASSVPFIFSVLP